MSKQSRWCEVTKKSEVCEIFFPQIEEIEGRFPYLQHLHGFLSYFFIALILPIQWTIANPVGADRPAKRQKKTSCVSTGWPVRSTVHSPDGASYFLPV